jgi:hypothetical protein
LDDGAAHLFEQVLHGGLGLRRVAGPDCSRHGFVEGEGNGSRTEAAS